MTKEQLKTKLDQIVNEDFLNAIKSDIGRLVESGGVDIERYEDNLVLPKLLLKVALHNYHHQLTFPRLSEHAESDYKNLLNF